MVDGYANPADVLAQIRSDRGQARRFPRSLRVRHVLAVVRGHGAARRRLAAQLAIVGRSLEHLRLAEAETRERLP